MAIQFKEIRQYLARNVRLSICFENLDYHDYMMISDISEEKYKDLYVYGIGMVDVEFSLDVYVPAGETEGERKTLKDDTIKPAIEIVLHERPRDIKRETEKVLLFKDLRPYLQIGRNFAVVNRKDWSCELFEYRKDIPEKYNDMFVYGIGMEDNIDDSDKNIEIAIKNRMYDSCLNKRMVIVLSDMARSIKCF